MKHITVLLITLALLRSAASQHGAEMVVAEKMLADMGLTRRPDLKHVSVGEKKNEFMGILLFMRHCSQQLSSKYLAFIGKYHH